MSLANIAWLLAAAGHRVLMLDWDFEAPGLHRYFRPFLEDPELQETRGLLDFFWEFAEAARVQTTLPASKDKSGTKTAKWFVPFTDLSRYITPLDYEFPSKEACLDLVGAGRQGPAYSLRASTFSWSDFYDKLGGGVFLEHVKQRLRADYDFILIDSRTGLSDTSGICTVQMPDEVIAFFTLNRQSVMGAASVADSIRDQRRLPSGERGIRIWPIATRLDHAEKERLETAFTMAEQAFRDHLWHLTRAERSSFWARCRIPHIPFYSYEEVLATFADRAGATGTMLAAMETIGGCLVGAPALKLHAGKRSSTRMAAEREKILQAFGIGVEAKQRPASPGKVGALKKPRIFLSSSSSDAPRPIIERIHSFLRREFAAEVVESSSLKLGTSLRDEMESELRAMDVLLCLVGRGWLGGGNHSFELGFALAMGKNTVGLVLTEQVRMHEIPSPLREMPAVAFDLNDLPGSFHRLRVHLSRALQSEGRPGPFDPYDPQKGQWGGKSSANGRALSATVKELSKHWFKVTLKVTRVSSAPLKGIVRFHLHDTFPDQIEEVEAKSGVATLTVECYGAFTVGVEADDGETTLELDLAALSKAPKLFRES